MFAGTDCLLTVTRSRAQERRRDRACHRQVSIDNKILAIPAASRRDLAIKIEIFDYYERDVGGQQ
jgi:hypothetical protein